MLIWSCRALKNFGRHVIICRFLYRSILNDQDFTNDKVTMVHNFSMGHIKTKFSATSNVPTECESTDQDNKIEVGDTLSLMVLRQVRFDRILLQIAKAPK